MESGLERKFSTVNQYMGGSIWALRFEGGLRSEVGISFSESESTFLGDQFERTVNRLIP